MTAAIDESQIRSQQRIARVRRLLTKYPWLANASQPGVTSARVLFTWSDESKPLGGFLSEFFRRYPDELSRLTPLDTIARDWRAVLASEKRSLPFPITPQRPDKPKPEPGEEEYGL